MKDPDEEMSTDDIVIFHPAVSQRDILLTFESSRLGERMTILVCATTGVVAMAGFTYYMVPLHLKVMSALTLLAALGVLGIITHTSIIRPLQTRLRITRNDQVVRLKRGSRAAAFYDAQFDRFRYVPDANARTVRIDIFPILADMVRAEAVLQNLREEGLDEGDVDFDFQTFKFERVCDLLREVIDLYVEDEPE